MDKYGKIEFGHGCDKQGGTLDEMLKQGATLDYMVKRLKELRLTKRDDAVVRRRIMTHIQHLKREHKIRVSSIKNADGEKVYKIEQG